MKMMNIIEEKERYEREVQFLENVILMTELLSLLLLVSLAAKLPTDPVVLLLIFSNLLVTIFFLLRPKPSSPGPFGNGFWLVLLSRFTLLLASFNFVTEYNFLLPLALLFFLASHSVHIFEYLVGSSKPHNDEVSTSTESKGIEDDTDDFGDVSKELEKMRELVKELGKDEEMMNTEMEFMEDVINSGLETHRKNLSLKILKFRKEFSDNEDKMKTYKEWMKKFILSEHATLEDHLRLNADKVFEDLLRVDEDIRASRDDVEVIAEEVLENHLVIKETVEAAKTTARRANLTYLATQGIIEEIHNMRWRIKEEDIEGFLELREEVRRMSLDFEARRMEAEDMAERAAEELSRATVELEEAVEIQEWEEYKTD